jgi:photosystem II stability/assembly factor-like uncharacterized protein
MARRWLEHTADKRSASHTGRVLQMVRFGRRPVPIIVGIALLCALVGAGAYRFAFADAAESWVVVSITAPIDYSVPLPPNDHRDVRVDSSYLAVSAVDSRTAFAVGWYSNTEDGTQRPLWGRTTDGVSWSVPTSMTAFTGQLRAVYALSASNAWAVGDGGLVLHWNGVSWSRSATDVTTAQLNGVAFVDESRGWAVGNGGAVIWTDDGGASWATQTVPGLTVDLNAVSGAGRNFALAVGDGGKCAKWNGTTWSTSSMGTGTTADLWSVDVLDSSHALAAGSFDTTRTKLTILQWQGSTWLDPVSAPYEPGFSNHVRAVTLSDKGTGVAVGEWGYIWRTSDGGTNWWFEKVPTSLGGEVDVTRLGADTASDDPSRVWVTGDIPTGSGGRKIARVYEGTLNYLPPDAPASLVATATAPGPAAIVRWNNVAGSAVDFQVERAKDTTSTWVPLDTPLATPGDMSFTDTFSGVPVADAWGSTWYYRVRARSARYGASEWVTTPGFRIDPDPPVTAVAPALGGWFTTTRTVTFSTSDGASGSGVDRYWMRVGTDAPTTARTYAAPEGTVALEWGSVDVAGNIESTKSATVNVDVTDPVTTPTVPVASMYWGPASIALDASDNLSGVAGTAWRLNAGTESSGTSILVSVPGSYTLEFHSHDVAGHVETTRTRTFRVVSAYSAPPTGAQLLSADPDPAVLVSWTNASDNESGFVVQRAKDSTAEVDFSTVETLGADVTEWRDDLVAYPDVDVKLDSLWYYRVCSYTPVGYSEWVDAGGIRLRDASPVTAAGVNGVVRADRYDVASDWLSSAQVTLTVLPAAATTFYRVDGAGEVATYTAPIPIAAGVHAIEYRSTLVGHQDEPTRTVTIRVDKTAPVTTANVGTLSRSTLVLTATDAESGVASTRYAIDGGAEQVYDPASPPATLRGVHSVAWWSIDKVGNTEATQYGTIVGGPQPSITTPRGSSSTRVRRTLTFSGKMTRATNHRRLTLMAYWFNGSSWVLARTKSVLVHTPRRGLTTYSGSIKFTAKGTWLVYARYEGDAYWVQTWSAGKVVRVR